VTDSYLEVAAENLGYKEVEELKKNKHRALIKVAPINRKERLFSIGTICDAFDLKRDTYYKYQKRFIIKKQIEQDVIQLVRESRRTLPREGTRKLMRSLKNDFLKYNLKIGRDQLFRILRENKLLIRRKKYSSRTTNSYHRFYKYGNIIKDLKINRPNKVCAIDIIYSRIL